MSEDAKNFRCYGVRRSNPFFGVAQIIQTTDSRSISANGIDWEIQILVERPNDTWGAPSQVKPKRQYLRFGVWNKVDGLTRVPANPLLNLTKMIKEANRIIEILLLESTHIPFPLRDRFELWLLDDKDQMPQALLASTTEASNRSSYNIKSWVCSDKEFPSIHLDRKNQIQTEFTSPNQNKSYLETRVKGRTKQGLQRWFRRTAEGDGVTLSSTSEQWATSKRETLPAENFPLLLLNSSWDEPLTRSIISDYHAWLSPYLLTLQNLPDDLRARLERKAAAQALAVADCWRLYPKILDKKIVDAARVEARLRRSRGQN